MGYVGFDHAGTCAPDPRLRALKILSNLLPFGIALRYCDEVDVVARAQEREWELENGRYRSTIPEKYRWRNWASNKEGITGDELLDFINEMFKALKSLNASKEDDPKGLIVREVFEDAWE